MEHRAPVHVEPPHPCLITPAADAALRAELASLEAARHGAGTDDERRLRRIRAVLDAGRITDGRRAAIGSRVTIRDDDGDTSAFSLVLPGDGDPDRGWLGVDSPLGVAVLGRRPGDEVAVAAPGGAWTARVVDVA